MLTISRYHSAWSLADLFNDDQWCPVCHGNQFSQIEGSLVGCNGCGAEFELRMTAGDPGVAIDCFPDPKGKYVACLPGCDINSWKQTSHDEWERKSYRLKRISPYYFWQVIKECESGLDDRQRWCSELAGYHSYCKTDPLGFEEVFYFDPNHIADLLTRERYARTPTGKKLHEVVDMAWVPLIGLEAWTTDLSVQKRYDLANKGHEAYQQNRDLWNALAAANTAYDAGYRKYNEVSKNWNEYRANVLAAELTAKYPGMYRALFVREQCERVWLEDNRTPHSGLPKEGETVRIKWPFYKRHRERDENFPLYETAWVEPLIPLVEEY
jgi:hypothetical protein